MADFEIKRGDRAPALVAVLKDRTGTPVPLTSATGVQFVMRGAKAATNTAPVINAAAEMNADQTANPGQVTYRWASGDTLHAGAYSAEFVVTWNDGLEQTFPTVGYLSVQVVDDLESHGASLVLPPASAAPRRLTVATDDAARESIARKTAATTAPVLSDDDLDQLVLLAKRPDGGYNLNRAAAEGWRWKAAKAAGGFTFSADGTNVDKSMIMAHCAEMVALYTRGQVRTVVADTGLAAFESDYYLT